ncbi:MAG: sigma-70 family RNA polymerase sigma factor [Acetobacteraceae bacterium]|nr:sigma-70 family RNA polymerase sigma factor [Acetobacteraceae bacterium]
MTASPTLADLDPLCRLADAAARRLCRALRLPAQEREDIRQDLICDLLHRLRRFDPARGDLRAFAAVVFRHRAARLAEQIRRERAGRAGVSLDDPLPGGDGLTVGDALLEEEGYGAWCGQGVDRIGALERRLDLERAAAAAIAPEDLPLCAALAADTPHAVAKQGLVPRPVLYRRLREMRLRLLAAGIAAAA